MDLIDGTPILDIKPYIPDYDRPRKVNNEAMGEEEEEETVKVPEWITTKSSSLQVLFTPRAMADLAKFSKDSAEFPLAHLETWQDLKSSVTEILSADPRSVYRKDKCGDKLYYVTVDLAHFTVWFDEDNVAEVLKVKSVGKVEKEVPKREANYVEKSQTCL